MTTTEIAEYLRGHPKAVPLLRAAVKEEEAHAGEAHYLGWEWHHVRAYPASLMKLVVDGLVTVNFKSNSSTCYLLTDRGQAKQVLSGYRST